METRNATEKALSSFCDVSAISNHLSEKDKARLHRISTEFSKEAVKVEEAGLKVLGVEVSQGIVRNYLFCLLTANAVKHVNKKGMHPTILEMGMGSGLNAVAALTMDPQARYIGVELNDVCIRFASREFIKRGFAKQVEIIKGSYQYIRLKKKADIIINENLGPHLVEEPQMLAARAALRFAKKDALFVPSGARLYALLNGKRKDIRKINFRRVPPSSISFSMRLSRRTEFRPGYDIVDFQGNAIMQKNPNNFIPHLPLIGEPMTLQQKGKKAGKVTLDFKGRRIAVENSVLVSEKLK